MSPVNPAFRLFVSYIDKSRDYYLNKGYGNPYRWAAHEDVPFAPLPKPLADCRVGLMTTAVLHQSDSKIRPVFAAPTSPIPNSLYTHHLSWHKTATHTNDLDSYLPINHMRQAEATGQIGSLSPRFYGVPTKFSQRQTREEHAPALLEMCRKDGVDIAFLFPL